MPPSDRYTRTAVVLHWLVAALVMAQFTWGWWMQAIPKEPVGQRVGAFNLHKSIGLTILALVLVRLAWRVRHRPPPLPPMPAWQQSLARGNHALLYLALIVMSTAGYLGSAFSGYPVKYFGWTIPAWSIAHPALKALMSTVHLVASWVLLAAVGLHLAGVAKHVLLERTPLLRRMAFDRRPPAQERGRRTLPLGAPADRVPP